MASIHQVLNFAHLAISAERLLSDLNRIRSYPLLREGVVVAGAIYDVKTGQSNLLKVN